MPIQRWSEDIWVVQLAEEPALSEELQSLSDQLHHAPRMPHLVIDLSPLRTINSASLGRLIQIRKLAVEHNSRMRMARPADPVWAVLLSTGLDKVFDFAEDVPSALAAIQMKP